MYKATVTAQRIGDQYISNSIEVQRTGDTVHDAVQNALDYIEDMYGCSVKVEWIATQKKRGDVWVNVKQVL